MPPTKNTKPTSKATKTAPRTTIHRRSLANIVPLFHLVYDRDLGAWRAGARYPGRTLGLALGGTPESALAACLASLDRLLGAKGLASILAVKGVCTPLAGERGQRAWLASLALIRELGEPAAEGPPWRL